MGHNLSLRPEGGDQRLEEIQAVGGGAEAGAEEGDGEADQEAVHDLPLRPRPGERQGEAEGA